VLVLVVWSLSDMMVGDLKGRILAAGSGSEAS